MLNSKDVADVTYSQISNMKHAVGFDMGKVRGTKHRKMEPYRNFYDAGERDIPGWDDLVRRGLAIKRSSGYYSVSKDGAEFIRLVTGVELVGQFPEAEQQ